MSLTEPEAWRRWHDYEREMHARVLESLGTVPEAARADRRWQQAVDLMAHLVKARHLWLHRLGHHTVPPGDIFPAAVPLDTLPGLFAGLEGRWTEYLARLTAAELDRAFDDHSLDGRAWRSRVEDILTQLHGHSLYHRGQVAQTVRALGGEPAITDFVFWSREARKD